MTSARRTDDWNAAQYERDTGFVTTLGAGIIDWLGPQPGERILDLGAGDGALTLKIADAGADVIAADASASMVSRARERGLTAHQVNGEQLQGFAAEYSPFDAVFSNAALHWMQDAAAVCTGVSACLKPGGRFVAEMGGQYNVARIGTALCDELTARGYDPAPLWPWYFPSVAQQAAVLETAGFRNTQMQHFERRTPLPDDIIRWLDVFAVRFMSVLPAAERSGFLTAVRERLKPQLNDADNGWWADYWRLRFIAIKQP